MNLDLDRECDTFLTDSKLLRTSSKLSENPHQQLFWTMLYRLLILPSRRTISLSDSIAFCLLAIALSGHIQILKRAI